MLERGSRLVYRDLTPLAWLQRPELDRTVCDAEQSGHLVANSLDEPPDLPIAPLDELDDEVRLSC